LLCAQGAEKRGDWYRTKDLVSKGSDWIVDQMKKSGAWGTTCTLLGGERFLCTVAMAAGRARGMGYPEVAAISQLLRIERS